MSKIEQFKRDLAVVIDDDLHTSKWGNIVDYTIIGLILISTLEVFLSTYSGIVEKYGIRFFLNGATVLNGRTAKQNLKPEVSAATVLKTNSEFLRTEPLFRAALMPREI